MSSTPKTVYICINEANNSCSDASDSVQKAYESYEYEHGEERVSNLDFYKCELVKVQQKVVEELTVVKGR